MYINITPKNTYYINKIVSYCLSIYPSIYLSVYLSICLVKCIYVHILLILKLLSILIILEVCEGGTPELSKEPLPRFRSWFRVLPASRMSSASPCKALRKYLGSWLQLTLPSEQAGPNTSLTQQLLACHSLQMQTENHHL